MIKTIISHFRSRQKLRRQVKTLSAAMSIIIFFSIVQGAYIYTLSVKHDTADSNTEAEEEAVIKSGVKPRIADSQVLGVTTDQDTSNVDSNNLDNREITILDEVIRDPFTDVPLNHINFVEIHYLKSKGIFDSQDQGRFYPERVISRVESIAMISKAAHIENSSSGRQIFQDVSPDSWFYEIINTAYNINLIDGFPDGTFQPYAPMTQAGFLKLTLEAFKIDVSRHSVANGEWFDAYQNFALSNQVIFESTPFNEITRSDAAEILYRVMRNL